MLLVMEITSSLIWKMKDVEFKSASASYTLECRRGLWALKVDVNRYEVTTVLGVKSKKCWTRLSLGETSGKNGSTSVAKTATETV